MVATAVDLGPAGCLDNALESDALVANVPLLAALAPLLRLGGVTMLQRAMKFASEKPTSLFSKTSALADASIRRVGVTSGEYELSYAFWMSSWT